VKDEVSIKKMRRRNTTSIRGAISMEVVRRLGRVNIGSLDGGKLFFLGALAGLGSDSREGGGTQKIVQSSDGPLHPAGDLICVALKGVIESHTGDGDEESKDGGKESFPNTPCQV
jgi:hypothetical protein